jgi:hypothetical protein
MISSLDPPPRRAEGCSPARASFLSASRAKVLEASPDERLGRKKLGRAIPVAFFVALCQPSAKRSFHVPQAHS